jgi:hypothetical protein
MTDLDHLIDAAAREITAEAAPADIRARVVETLRAGDVRETGDVRHAWWLAAAAVIFLAMYFGWPARPPVEQTPSPPPLVTNGGAGTAPASVRPDPPRTPTRARISPPPRAEESTIVSIPALDVTEALGIAPLDASPAPVPALEAVAPLEIEGLDIKPLTSPAAATGGQ